MQADQCRRSTSAFPSLESFLGCFHETTDTARTTVRAERVRGPSLVQLLTFDVGGRRFALSAATVREVTRAVAVTPLPKAPAIVEGAINVRGTLVPVLNLRQRFGLPPCALSLEQHFIVARAGPRPVALRVDRAVDLVSIAEAEIEPAARLVPGIEYVAGIAKLPDGLIVIHDLERFLSLEEAAQVDVATGEAVVRRKGR